MSSINHVIEYQPEICFEQFGNKVSEARQGGDREDACAIKIETIKLLDNATMARH